MQFFLTFVLLAGMSTLMILAIFALKAICNTKCSPKFHYYIWSLLVIRLLFPILPQSVFSLYNVINFFPNHVKLAIVEASSPVSNGFSTGNSFLSSPKETPPFPLEEESKIAPLKPIDTIAVLPPDGVKNFFTANIIVFLVYLLGVCIFLCYFMIMYFRQKKRILRTSVLCNDGTINEYALQIAKKLHIKKEIPIYWGERSLLLGVFSPVIVMHRLHSDDFRFILIHELTHYKHGDNGIKFFFSFLKCAYWFNPLVGLALNQANQDLEFLCDSRSVSKFALRKDEYAMLLYKSIKTENQKDCPVISSSTMSSSGKQLIHRLHFLSSNSRPKKRTIVVSIVLALCIACLCLTNPIIAMNAMSKDAQNYRTVYQGFVGNSTVELPKDDAIMTVEGFLDTALLAFQNLSLPTLLQDKINAMTNPLEQIQAKYGVTFPPETKVTKEMAAFLLNAFWMELQTPAPFSYQDPNGLVPAIMEKTRFEQEILEKMKDPQQIKRMQDFYLLKGTDTPIYDPISGIERPLTASEQQEIMELFPITALYSVYVLDPNATQREIQNLEEIITSVYHHSQSQRSIANPPELVPRILTEQSMKQNILQSLKSSRMRKQVLDCYTYYDKETAPIEMLQTYPVLENIPVYVLNKNLDSKQSAALKKLLSDNANYTYEMLLHDHATVGYHRHIEIKDNLTQIMKQTVRKETESLPEMKYFYLLKEDFERLLSKETDEENLKKLKAFYTLKDPNSSELTPQGIEEMIQNFPIIKEDGSVYILDPYASEREISMVAKIMVNSMVEQTAQFAYQPYFPYEDEAKINATFLTAVKNMQTYGVIKEEKRFEPTQEVTFAKTMEYVNKLVCNVIYA